MEYQEKPREFHLQISAGTERRKPEEQLKGTDRGQSELSKGVHQVSSVQDENSRFVLENIELKKTSWGVELQERFLPVTLSDVSDALLSAFPVFASSCG